MLSYYANTNDSNVNVISSPDPPAAVYRRQAKRPSCSGTVGFRRKNVGEIKIKVSF